MSLYSSDEYADEMAAACVDEDRKRYRKLSELRNQIKDRIYRVRAFTSRDAAEALELILEYIDKITEE